MLQIIIITATASNILLFVGVPGLLWIGTVAAGLTGANFIPVGFVVLVDVLEELPNGSPPLASIGS